MALDVCKTGEQALLCVTADAIASRGDKLASQLGVAIWHVAEITKGQEDSLQVFLDWQ